MATAAKKVPLAKAPARKPPAKPARQPRIGALEKSVVAGIAAATKAKTLTSPRNQVTAQILKSVAKAADKALADGDSRQLVPLVDRMLELVPVLDPGGGGGDGGAGSGNDLESELAKILGSGPEVRNT